MQRITPQSKGFAKWYQDVVREAELAESAEVRGCGVVRPYGFAIWEAIRDELNRRIKEDGVQNLYFPLFLPIKNLEAESAHVEGFSPELAVVTHAGGEELKEPIAVRPTSEAAMYPTFAKWIESYRDLPFRVNQWANVVRWEKRPRAFLRWSEFLWQEGHSVFATREEAIEEMWHMLGIYRDMYRWMAIPTLSGRKSELEKFAGADITTTVEVMAKDGKAIQGATSHHLGQNFAKVFEVKYLGEDGTWHYGYQNSWGMSWRSLGALIMVHGDDRGLRLPATVAPVQAVVVPVYKEENKAEVLAASKQIAETLKKTIRVHFDDREGMTPGAKYYEWEIKGVPLRIEVGAKELADGVVSVFARDVNERSTFPLESISEALTARLSQYDEKLYRDAEAFRDVRIVRIESIDEIPAHLEKGAVFFEASWSESEASERLLKERFGMVSRVLPETFAEARPKNDRCFITGEPARHDWIFAKSY